MIPNAHGGILSTVSSKEITVRKRDGRTEAFSVDKVNKVVQWATENLKGTNISDVIAKAGIRLYDGIETEKIHDALIEGAIDLITKDTPNYQYVASRLVNFALRKQVWKDTEPPSLRRLVERNEQAGVYDKLSQAYSPEEWIGLGAYIKHDRDFEFTYAGIRQMMDKYLVQDRSTGTYYETPQFAYMLIAATLYQNYDRSVRMDYVRRYYDLISTHVINLPTPQLAGIRTPLRSYASCMLIDVDDNKKSIFASAEAIGLATTDRYGIGINVGRVRAVNSKIGRGEVLSTGVIPFLKMFAASVKCSQQNGIRGGSATVNYPIWHYEAPELLPLKNNAGTEESRVRTLDYCVGMSKEFYQAAIKQEDWNLFSPHQTPELFDTFGTEKWIEHYNRYSQSKDVMKRTVKANELFQEFIKQRIETGRIYCLNMDHVQAHSAWKLPVHMTNLCVEIQHPVVPLKADSGEDAEIGTCILGAFNWLKITNAAQWSNACEMMLRTLWQIINHQEYFNEAARRFTFNRRSVAVGVTNFAAWLAKHGYKWTDEDAPSAVSKNMEHQAYWLTYWANKLVDEFGVAPAFKDTKYSDGVMPIDTYCKNIDEFVTTDTQYDWEELRNRIKDSGMAFSTLMALMPCESSSVVSNATNGVEPPREAFGSKKSKAGVVPFAVPFYGQPAAKNYQFAYDIKDNKAILRIWAALVKWIDMGASVNVYYRYADYPDGIIPQQELMKDHLYAWKVGIPSLYYLNTDDKNEYTSQEIVDNCESGACAI